MDDSQAMSGNLSGVCRRDADDLSSKLLRRLAVSSSWAFAAMEACSCSRAVVAAVVSLAGVSVEPADAGRRGETAHVASGPWPPSSSPSRSSPSAPHSAVESSPLTSSVAAARNGRARARADARGDVDADEVLSECCSDCDLALDCRQVLRM